MNQVKNHTKNKKRYFNKKRGDRNKSSNFHKNIYESIDKIEETHMFLYLQYLEARKNFQENFFRGQKTEHLKRERLFRESINKLREFEKKVPPKFLNDFLDFKGSSLPCDHDYSTQHGLETFGHVDHTEGKLKDPHLLNQQLELDYSGDTEESVGLMEDYERYKGAAKN